jgi:DNA-binding response OmpR family regulator
LAILRTLPVLFCSGYAPETEELSFLLEAGVRLIEKPFDPEVLVGSVHEALESAKDARVIARSAQVPMPPACPEESHASHLGGSCSFTR